MRNEVFAFIQRGATHTKDVDNSFFVKNRSFVRLRTKRIKIFKNNVQITKKLWKLQIKFGIMILFCGYLQLNAFCNNPNDNKKLFGGKYNG